MSYGTKQLWYSIILLTCILIFSESLNLPVTTISASTTTLATLNDDYPSLFVTKRVENAETVTGEDFDAKAVLGNSYVVSVTINNIGSKIAYNVTFIDTPINPWVFEIDGLTKISYLHISPNETQQFSYLITAKSLGTFNLQFERCEYITYCINYWQYILDISINCSQIKSKGS
ncbi:MAG: hypothetical protein ACW964_19040 [Candidatus Hodarchaeales archaeon]|jgi:hypothetical protein